MKNLIKDSQPTEWLYLTKHIRYRFESIECLHCVKTLVIFEKYTHWSAKGFHFKRKW